MKKLVKGIIDFRQNIQPGYREKFAQLALGQSPDCLFIACSDSRVVPNLFASTDPGDLFVIRNVGNLIPQCGSHGHSTADESEAAAIEFSLLNLNVSEIVVCGHSECGAMHALMEGRDRITTPHLRAWLRHAEPSLLRLAEENSLKTERTVEDKKVQSLDELEDIDDVNLLSQMNVLQQLEHLKSYPIVRKRLDEKKLRLHAWWFELRSADVYFYNHRLKQFILIDETLNL